MNKPASVRKIVTGNRDNCRQIESVVSSLAFVMLCYCRGATRLSRVWPGIATEPIVSHLAKWGARFLRDETGTTAIEYAIIAGSLSIVIATAVQSLGTTVLGLFTATQAIFN
jgi:pilus assembly protein Flp/PilA